MTQPSHTYEEISFQQFILFIKSNNKQIEENINIYLNLEPLILENERKVIQTLLESFLLFLSAPKIEDINETYDKYLETWLQSHLPILNVNHFSMFRLIFEKSIVTLMSNLKHAHTISILMFLLSIFSHLIHSYHKWMNVEPMQLSKAHEENAELKRLKLLDQLDELLINSSGIKDFAHILKKCEEFFHYKRCVFYAYIPWSNQFYGTIGLELPKVQSMRGQLSLKQSFVFNSKKPVFLKNPNHYIKKEHITFFNLSSVIFVPIVHDQQVFGWLTFDQLGEEFDYSKDELNLLEHVGKRLGLYLSRKDDEVSIDTDLQLTERESMILNLLAEGYNNKKMAELLQLSEHTIRDYVSSLMTKFKAKNRTQVVVYGFRLGILK
ncbi:LuxR C-terminal-related transcriptional regulator [Peribacillus simplex]|uniref:LuxR C-terminal-related transcriptional regulator n=1 Tax=Peribacillus simplex TaxID=1478 RepID=UPI002E1AB386|nr:LuxR C-terminal-related transcriptional regulator [Peribacillus simplex]MED3984259.1 LuxR C-terminal-related transcriptional regulator [Peribacillus simplex]MED4097093.1 LuxR C-terminal-related transcriptional regulator [Peribacillus simplex]